MLLTILAQITTAATDTAQALAAPATQQPEESLSLLGLLLKGGYMMYPIFLLSIIAIYIFIERLLYIRKAGYVDPRFVDDISQRLDAADVKGAAQYCRKENSPISRIILKGLGRLGAPIRDIEAAIEATARVEVYNMEKNMSFLAAIAAIAPMFGFLGTVSGMIRAFHNISLADNISIGIIASGIYEKMITSASGLIVGLMAHILYTYLNSLIERSVNRMEVTALEFVETLQKSAV